MSAFRQAHAYHKNSHDTYRVLIEDGAKPHRLIQQKRVRRRHCLLLQKLNPFTPVSNATKILAISPSFD
jgi:hypothetical protein